MAGAELRIFLGWDPREELAYRVAEDSIRARSSRPVSIQRIMLDELQSRALYLRETERRDGRLWDVISGAPMSTEHAIARFFVPMLCRYSGWALSADCDILCRSDIASLFALADDRYAVMVVKHQHVPTEATKMDGQIQTVYARKNWSSVILWNCVHPGHRPLTRWVLNEWPGRDLHAFKWLQDKHIGELPATWNHLVGVNPPDPQASLVHFTLGTPDIPGYEDCPFAEEWRGYLREGVA